jgi:hypothetical protein
VLKYSLGTLLLAVAAAGLGCAAFVNFSPGWVQTMFVVVFLLLACALAAALVARGPARNFACGFAAVGGAYFLLAFSMTPELREERFPTGRAVDWLYRIQQKSQAAASPAATGSSMMMSASDSSGSMGYSSMEGMGYSGMGGYGSGMSPGGPGSMGMGMPVGPVFHPAPRELKDIGHCLWALLLGAAGGAVAQMIARKTRPAAESAATR